MQNDGQQSEIVTDLKRSLQKDCALKLLLQEYQLRVKKCLLKIVMHKKTFKTNKLEDEMYKSEM